jgi:cytochrome c553
MRALVVAFWLSCALVATNATAQAPAAARSLGESLYLRGADLQGVPLRATRGADSELQGDVAACANCHQRSGLGGREGRIVIPPITARYLFRPLSTVQDERDLPFVAGMHGDREPYTDATLARAITDGLDAEGKPLSFLMPRYELAHDDMAALLAHLKQLDRRDVPGVSASTLHFATIVTPDADPVKRRGMLAVMNQFFADRNIRQMVPAPHLMTSGKTSYSGMMFKVQRRWELHVWELGGPESTWAAQLERRLAAEPVLAAISGLGGRSWAPIHAFCERAALPCLFPNIDAPPAEAGRDFYSVYFSRGVLLEAELIGQRLLGEPGRPPARRVHQIHRAGDVGEAGAAALAATLRARGIAVTGRTLAPQASAAALAAAVRAEPHADALVLWLRPGDLAALPATPPGTGTGPVMLSGLMAGLEHATLPDAWRAVAEMAYPVDLPDRRRVRVDFALGWFRARQIPLVAEQTQIDTYLALGLLSETLKGMADTFVRDYLVEHLEDTLAHRIMTGYYPRLGMAAGQRYASKGGYLVTFVAPPGPGVAADGGWTVP